MDSVATVESSDWRLKPAAGISIDVVIPVFNEAPVLDRSVRRVHEFFMSRLPHRWRIVIAENGSTDGTLPAARRLRAELPRVDVLAVSERGRGRALRAAWTRGDADIAAYIDADLSAELESFHRLFRALIEDRCDIAVGSRLARGARTTRSLKRQLISRGYNRLLRSALGVGFTDAQTGFKAMTREVVRRVLPLVKDQSWFLDTELLVLAERLGYRIADIPIAWVEGDDSRVNIVETAWEDIKGVWRLRRRAGD